MQENETPILLKDMAKELGLEKSWIRKMIKRLGLNAIQVRLPETGNQSCLALSPADYEFLKQHRKDRGFDSQKSFKPLDENLYIVEIDPEMRPGRIKVGISGNPEGRFSSYRTTNPGMVALRIYPAPMACEGYLIALADLHGERVGAELFDMADGLEDFLAIADKAF
jgi:hypothetical protein